MPLLSILFGALLPLTAAWTLGALVMRRQAPEIQLAVGSVALSFLVFVLLLCGLGYWWAFLALSAVPLAIGGWKLRGGRPFEKPVRLPLTALVLAPYGVWYFVNALAPETQADGITYHLGLPLEYLRI